MVKVKNVSGVVEASQDSFTSEPKVEGSTVALAVPPAAPPENVSGMAPEQTSPGAKSSTSTLSWKVPAGSLRGDLTRMYDVPLGRVAETREVPS